MFSKALKKLARLGLIVLVVSVLLAVGALLFIKYYPGFGDVPSEESRKIFAKKTSLYEKRQFKNETYYKMMTGTQSEPNSMRIPKNKLPIQKIVAVEQAGPGELKIIWLGHSSILLQMGSRNILIDPIMSNRCSPVGFAGPKRFADPPLAPENMPPIDVLFISHDHYDHLDYQTIKNIDSKVKDFIVPLGVDAVLRGWGVSTSKIHTMYWWENIELDGVRYTLTPAKHFSGRDPFNMNSTLWGGIYIEDQAHKVYYTGDTGYYEIFSEIYRRFGKTDVMLADSAQYDMGWAETHMFPEQAVQAAADAHAEWLIPVHWGVFSISNHAWNEPPRRVAEAARDQRINLATPRIGQIVDYRNIGLFNELWWEKWE